MSRANLLSSLCGHLAPCEKPKGLRDGRVLWYLKDGDADLGVRIQGLPKEVPKAFSVHQMCWQTKGASLATSPF